MAMVESVHHFGYYLYGKQFVAFTDHKPLCSPLISDRLNGRLCRLGMKLHHWFIDIKYLSGLEKGLADALSREERKKETVVKDRLLFGAGGFGGAASTLGDENKSLQEGGREPVRET